MVDTAISGALGIDGCHICGKPPGGNSVGIGQRNHPVDGDF